MSCEVDPNKQLYSDSCSSSSEESDMDDSSAVSNEEPSSKDRGHKSTCSHTITNNTHTDFCHGGKSSRKPSCAVAIATNAAGRRSEIARQISHLLSASSPLVGENLKVARPLLLLYQPLLSSPFSESVRDEYI